jgi:ferritin-like metal-binding protein YciE
MDASPEVLAETVRAKRSAIDNDLEVLRTRLRKVDPLRLDIRRWATTVLPIIAGTGGIWWWAKRRRAVNSLEQLLIYELSDLYATEQQLVPALRTMRTRASNSELQMAFEQHLHETEGHADRLQRVFRSIGATPRRATSDAVSGIVEVGERLLKRKVDSDVRDAWLIATAQRVEHLEIAGYGTARTHAQTLGYTHAAQMLQQTLEEERAADQKLTHLAERFVNPQSIRTTPPPA